jgi:DUF971 family protein
MPSQPLEIKLLQKQKMLHISFDDGKTFALPTAYLRANSPSADLGTPGDDVNIIGIDPVGHYAIRLSFDDGHNTGIYSWETLYKLGETHLSE